MKIQQKLTKQRRDNNNLRVLGSESKKRNAWTRQTAQAQNHNRVCQTKDRRSRMKRNKNQFAYYRVKFQLQSLFLTIRGLVDASEMPNQIIHENKLLISITALMNSFRRLGLHDPSTQFLSITMVNMNRIESLLTRLERCLDKTNFVHYNYVQRSHCRMCKTKGK